MCPRDDGWYRRTTWSPKVAEEFERRLARSRGQRTQQIKLQAQALAGTGRLKLADPAIALARRYLEEEPQGFFEVEAYLVIAEASRTKRDTPGAVEAYRNAVEAERRSRGNRCLAYLEFAWFVATHDLTNEFDSALTAMESMDDDDLVFPVSQYKYFATLALILAATGDKKNARRMAQNAQAAAARASPFARHKDIGIVKGIDEDIVKRIRRLAAYKSPERKR